MNIFGSVQLQIVGKKLEITNKIRHALLDENETMQPTKVRQAKTNIP